MCLILPMSVTGPWCANVKFGATISEESVCLVGVSCSGVRLVDWCRVLGSGPRLSVRAQAHLPWLPGWCERSAWTSSRALTEIYKCLGRAAGKARPPLLYKEPMLTHAGSD